MDEMNNNNLEANDVVSGVDNVTHKGGKKIAAVTAGIIAAAGIGGGVAYTCSDYVKNQVKLAVCKPESYYAWVNEENAEDFAKQIAEKYSAGIDRIDKGSTASLSLKYDLSDTALDLIKDEISGEDGEFITDNLKSVEFGITAAAKKGDSNNSLFMNWNDDRLLTLDASYIDADQTGFFRIPELTEKWMSLDMSSIIEEAMSSYGEDETTEKLEDALTKFVTDPGAYLTADELESEIVRYVGVWNASAGDVTLEKKSTVDICDISVEYTVVSVEINNEKAKEIVTNFTDELRDDSVIKGVIIDKLNAVSEDEYNDALDKVIESINEDVEDNDETVTFSTYIDPKGVIRGFRAESADATASCIMGLEGDQVRGEMYVTEDGTETCRSELTATETDKKYTGSIEITSDDEECTIEFTDFEIVDETLGTFNADTTFIVPGDEEEEKVNVKFSAEGNTQRASADVNVDGDNYGTVTLSLSYENSASPEFPDKGDTLVIDDIDDFDIDTLKEYVTEDEVSSFLKTLLVKVGYPEDTADEYGKSFAGYIYEDRSYNYSYDDDDHDYDDWDDEDEDDKKSSSATDKDNDEDEDGDYSYLFEDDEFADDIVEADDGQAYLTIADSECNATYFGMSYDPLAYKATVADIKGDGTYTVGVTADTDGYKKAMDGKKPNGIYFASIDAVGLDGFGDAEVTAKSIKVDGKEYPITSDMDTEGDDESFTLSLYFDGLDSYSCVDLSDVKEWTTVEVTFEVKGYK